MAADDEVLKVTRGAQMLLNCGHYYVLNTKMNAVTGKHIDPAKWARELGVLKDWEEVIE